MVNSGQTVTDERKQVTDEQNNFGSLVKCHSPGSLSPLQDVDFKDEPNITLGFLLARAFFKYKSISCFSWMKVILSRFYLSLANTNNLGPNKSLLFVAFP